MYTWKKWDKTSPINSVNSTKVLDSLSNPTEIYLINDGDETILIQTDKDRPYKELSLAECVQKQVDDMNYSQQMADYTIQVYTGKMSLDDVPAEFKQGVLNGILSLKSELTPATENDKLKEALNELTRLNSELEITQAVVDEIMLMGGV